MWLSSGTLGISPTRTKYFVTPTSTFCQQQLLETGWGKGKWVQMSGIYELTAKQRRSASGQGEKVIPDTVRRKGHHLQM